MQSSFSTAFTCLGAAIVTIIASLLIQGGYLTMTPHASRICEMSAIAFILAALFSLANANDRIARAAMLLKEFCHGKLDRRLVVNRGKEGLSRLEQKINNLLDTVDLSIRRHESLPVLEGDAKYREHLSNSGLMAELENTGRTKQSEDDANAMSASAANKPHRDMELIDNCERAIMTALRDVTTAAAQVQKISDKMVGLSERTTGDSEAVSDGAQKSRHNVESVAAATEQLARSIQEISARVSESTRIAHEAVRHAKQSNEIVTGLNAASEKIGDVVSLISNIAGQTNLLALNATIEAARAGEAGRGFAVVASEVKSLANQTAKATDEISQQIGTIQTSTGQAVAAIQEISKTINQINDISTNIAAAVEQQSAATAQISRNVQQAANSTQSLAQNIGQVTNVSKETSQSAHTALQSANQLLETTAVLDAEVHNFVTVMKS